MNDKKYLIPKRFYQLSTIFIGSMVFLYITTGNDLIYIIGLGATLIIILLTYWFVLRALDVHTAIRLVAFIVTVTFFVLFLLPLLSYIIL